MTGQSAARAAGLALDEALVPECQQVVEI